MNTEDRLMPADGSTKEHAGDTGNHYLTGSNQKPGFRERFCTLKLYVFLCSVLGVLINTDSILRYALLTTLERRFKFASMESGAIISSFDSGHVIVLLFLSKFGGRINKSRACALGAFLGVISGFLWAMPHFVFGSGIDYSMVPVKNDTGADLLLQFCKIGRPDVCASSGVVDWTNSTSNFTDVSNERNNVESQLAFWTFFLSQALMGGSLAPFLTVGITYIDDNTDPQTSALCIGIIFSVATFGMVFGFLIGAFTTSLHVDFTPMGMSPADPEWIGAYWLGSIIIAFLMIFFTVPLIFFPTRLRKDAQTNTTSVLERAISSETIEHAKHRAEQMRPILQKKVQEIKTEPAKDARKPVPLYRNILYIFTTIAMIMAMYMAGGHFVFLPKYFEVQFQLPTMVSNIATSVVTALAMATGTFFGGYMTARFELDMRGSYKLIFFGMLTGTIAFIGTIFLGCPSPNMAGTVGSNGLMTPTTPCNANCSCAMDFAPVCGSTGLNYFSACHAGCTKTTARPEQMPFANCTCIDAANNASKKVGWADHGFCPNDCKTLIPYTILVFVSNFAIFSGTAPVTAMVVRCVHPSQKNVALGITNFLTSILGTIPAPILFGRLIDSTCIMKEPTCAEPGRCLIYDNAGYRYVMHGVTLACITVGLFFCAFMWYLAPLQDPNLQNEGSERKVRLESEKGSEEEDPIVERVTAA